MVATVRAHAHQETHMAQFHEFTMTSITGDQVAFSDFSDTACLIVNVASA